jgi:hypothetical protein
VPGASSGRWAVWQVTATAVMDRTVMIERMEDPSLMAGRAIYVHTEGVTFRVVALSLSLLAFPPAQSGAQCPNGSPPPCARPQQASSRPVPPSGERARYLMFLPFRNVTAAGPLSPEAFSPGTRQGEALVVVRV